MKLNCASHLSTRCDCCPFPAWRWKGCARKWRKFSRRFLALNYLSWLYLQQKELLLLVFVRARQFDWNDKTTIFEWKVRPTCQPLWWQSLWQSWSTSKRRGISVSLTSRMSTCDEWKGGPLQYRWILWDLVWAASRSNAELIPHVDLPGCNTWLCHLKAPDVKILT